MNAEQLRNAAALLGYSVGIECRKCRLEPSCKARNWSADFVCKIGEPHHEATCKNEASKTDRPADAARASPPLGKPGPLSRVHGQRSGSALDTSGRESRAAGVDR